MCVCVCVCVRVCMGICKLNRVTGFTGVSCEVMQCMCVCVCVCVCLCRAVVGL